MLALKLKLEPAEEQLGMLNEMFWKWASICNRISIKGMTKGDLRPPENASGIWFSLTQLNQAQTDVNDLLKALKQSGIRIKHELENAKKRRDKIAKALKDPAQRETDPGHPSAFRPKSYAEKGFIKAIYRTTGYWQRKLDELSRLIAKKEATLEKIETGRVFLKPKRISLHPNSFLINFAKGELVLRPFHKGGSCPKDMRLRIITAPEQPQRGSSKNSAKWMHDRIVQYVAFALDSRLFGMNRAEEALLKAKKPEKLEKKKKKLDKKMENLDAKLKEIGKWLGRRISETESKTLREEYNGFFDTLKKGEKPEKSKKYVALVSSLAHEIVSRDSFFSPYKYPILIRKPSGRARAKEMHNLKPGEWEYYLQLSYEPLEESKFKPATVMGIDRGIKHLLAVSILDPSTGKFVFNKLVDNPIAGWKRKQRNLRRSLQHLERRVRAQKNTHLHENQMKKRIRTIQNKVDNLLHNISSELVSLAKERKSVIVMENIKGLKQHGRKRPNYFLSLFDYGKIAQLINYKAKMAGVQVYDINPYGTSQNCAKCLLKEKDGKYVRDEKNSKIGNCSKCGQIDADLNAARTIAVCYHKKYNDPRPFGERYF